MLVISQQKEDAFTTLLSPDAKWDRAGEDTEEGCSISLSESIGFIILFFRLAQPNDPFFVDDSAVS